MIEQVGRRTIVGERREHSGLSLKNPIMAKPASLITKQFVSSSTCCFFVPLMDAKADLAAISRLLLCPSRPKTSP